MTMHERGGRIVTRKEAARIDAERRSVGSSEGTLPRAPLSIKDAEEKKPGVSDLTSQRPPQPFSVYTCFRQPLRVARGFFWFVLFCLLLLPALEKCGAQGHPPPLVLPGEWSVVDLTLPALGEYEQPPIYETWWKEIGACEHVTVPLELTRRVHFVFVNSPSMFVDGDYGVLGFASAPTLTIYIALPYIYTKTIVTHEMLHWLDYVNGIDEGKDYHPPSRFGVGKKAVCGITRFYQ